MAAWIVKLISWLLSLWSALPETTKNKIIEAIAESFTELFINFYRSQKKEGEVTNEQP